MSFTSSARLVSSSIPSPVNRINVKDPPYLAVGDGVATDTSPLQSAFGAARFVEVPEGTYLVDAMLTWTLANSRLFLHPNAVIKLKNSANATILRVSASHVIVEGGTFDGNRANNPTGGSGVLVDAPNTSQTVEDVLIDTRVVSTKGSGIKATASGSGAVTRRVTVSDCTVDDTAAEGIFLSSAQQSNVIDNYVSRTGNHGIISSRGSSNHIARNHVVQAGLNKTSGFAHGIAIDGSGGSFPNARHKVVQNYVEDPYDAGIEVADSVTDVLIKENVVNGAGQGASPSNKYGIYFGGGLTLGQRAIIEGNIVTRAKSNGIEVNAPDDAHRTTDVAVNGNFCYENDENGIYMRFATNFGARGNHCWDNDNGQTAKHGIRLESVTDGIVALNRCFDDQGTKTQDFGLKAAAAVADVLVALNDFQGNASGSVDATGFTGASRIVGNLGFNPQGTAAITVTASPFTYVNNDFVSEAVYIWGGTVSLVQKNGNTIFIASPATVWLEPGESVTVTYSAGPTMVKDRK